MSNGQMTTRAGTGQGMSQFPTLMDGYARNSLYSRSNNT